MEVGPDGSLCHITSSAKDIVNNIRILKISEDEVLNSDEPQFKLVFMGEEESDCESLSEKSDSSIELFHETNIKLTTENKEKEKDFVKVKEVVDESRPQNEKFTKTTFNERFRSKSHRSHKNYKFSGSRNFNSSGKVTNPYNQLKPTTSSQNIEPWINPPQILYGIYPQFSTVQNPLLNNLVPSDKPVGLLGDFPSSSHFPQHNFESSNQRNSFGPDQHFWNSNYSPSYQTAQNRRISPPLHNTKYYQNRWKNQDKRKSWKRNQNKSQQERRNDDRRFDYRK